MKELPLLSSDFAYFSWETQFGTATSEQLQNAYTALTSEGMTTEFHRNVWNDLVERLYQSITQANLSWNTTYGTVSETKIKEKYGILTARRFNAVTINIDTIIKNLWRWEVVPLFHGYVGRSRFFGITEKGKNSDYLYGEHILELARVVNLFIAILKNEADFADIKIAEVSHTPTNVNLLPRPSAPMFFSKSSTTNKYVNLLRVPSTPMYLSLYSASRQSSELAQTVGAVLSPSNEITKSLSVSNMFRAVGATLPTFKGVEKTLYNATVRKNLVTKMNSINVSNAPYEVETIERNPMHLAHESLSVAKTESIMNNATPTFVNGSDISKSYNDISVVIGRPSFIDYAIEISDSINEASADKVQTRGITASENAKFDDMASLSKKAIILLGSKVLSKTKAKTSLSYDVIEEAWHVQTDSNLHIYQVYDGYKEESELYIDTEYWLAPIQNGTDLFIRQLYDENEMKGE